MIKSIRYGDKYRKALYKLMNNIIYGATTENLRKSIVIGILDKEKYYLK